MTTSTVSCPAQNPLCHARARGRRATLEQAGIASRIHHLCLVRRSTGQPPVASRPCSPRCLLCTRVEVVESRPALRRPERLAVEEQHIATKCKRISSVADSNLSTE